MTEKFSFGPKCHGCVLFCRARNKFAQPDEDTPFGRHLKEVTKYLNIGLHYKKRHIRDILGRTIFFCHTYDTSMTIIGTKLGIIIDVVGSYFYDKKS